MTPRAGLSIVAALALAAAAAAASPHKHTTAKRAATRHAVARRAAHAKEAIDPSRFSMPAGADAMPAVRYGKLTREQCGAELAARKIAFTRETARGVLAPVRLAGPLHGVVFRGDAAEAERATSPYEIADCRLVLALDDFAEILAAHDIVEVHHYSMYRPPPKSWPADQIGTRHAGALALDAARFRTKDGRTLSVLDDFHGHIGGKTCGKGAVPDKVTPAATELRQILCEAVDRHLFNVVLTPDYNKPHRNHFHLEVTAGVKWFLVH